MRLKNKPIASGSFERPPQGKYLGIIQGVCDIGMQPSDKYEPSEQILIRWELHTRKGPSLDSKGEVHCVNANFTATVSGDKSKLGKMLRAHGLELPRNGETDSHEWLGLMAWLVIEPSKTGKSMVVMEISKFDPEADAMDAPTPKLTPDHWERTDDCGAPSWACYMVDKAIDETHDYGSEYVAPSDSARKHEEAVAVGTESGEDDSIPF